MHPGKSATRRYIRHTREHADEVFVLRRIMMLYGWDFHNFRPDKRTPAAILDFLRGKPSLGARQRALWTILKSVTPEEYDGHEPDV